MQEGANYHKAGACKNKKHCVVLLRQPVLNTSSHSTPVLHGHSFFLKPISYEKSYHKLCIAFRR